MISGSATILRKVLETVCPDCETRSTSGKEKPVIRQWVKKDDDDDDDNNNDNNNNNELGRRELRANLWETALL